MTRQATSTGPWVTTPMTGGRSPTRGSNQDPAAANQQMMYDDQELFHRYDMGGDGGGGGDAEYDLEREQAGPDTAPPLNARSSAALGHTPQSSQWPEPSFPECILTMYDEPVHTGRVLLQCRATPFPFPAHPPAVTSVFYP